MLVFAIDSIVAVATSIFWGLSYQPAHRGLFRKFALLRLRADGGAAVPAAATSQHVNRHDRYMKGNGQIVDIGNVARCLQLEVIDEASHRFKLASQT